MIIGITGHAGAGKTTSAELIASFFDQYHVTIISFAKALKQFAMNLGWNGVKDAKGRRLLQLLGTEVGRNCISEDIWCKHWKRNIKAAYDLGYNLILSDDVRFPNEIDYIKKYNGKIIKIIGRGYTDIDSTHGSESFIDSLLVDYTISNDGSIADLKIKLRTLIREIGIPANGR